MAELTIEQLTEAVAGGAVVLRVITRLQSTGGAAGRRLASRG